jgi:prepilin-type processing-associated H-X9-DG protein
VIGGIETPFYFCPSRRENARQAGRVLMDYAGATPGVNLQPNGTYPVWNDFWQNGDFSPNPCKDKLNFQGVIVRSRGHEDTSMRHVKDGASNTMLIGEKWLNSTRYQSGDWHDDRGWTDGWDPDIMRFTGIQPHSDSIQDPGDGPFRFGGTHSGGFNACFTDGSVHFLKFGIDMNTFNNMGHRNDGNPLVRDN